MPAAVAIPAIISAAGSIGSSLIGAHSAGSAASTQEQAAQGIRQQAIDAAGKASGLVNASTSTADTGLTGGETQGNQVISDALAAQKAAVAPYIAAGTTSLGQLQTDLTGLTAPGAQFKFNPATSPQLQFEQQQAEQALQRQAAASGTVLGGGEDRASNIMNTGLASTYLNQAFNQALGEYNTNRQNVLTQIQGLTNLTGLGYNATGMQNQDIGTAALATNSNIQNTAQGIAANQIRAGMYSGTAGLQAAQIGEEATAASANAQAAANLAAGKSYGGLAGGLANLAGGVYGQIPRSGPSADTQPGWTGTAAPPPGGYDTGTDTGADTTYV
jgi:hypothetical protein